MVVLARFSSARPDDYDDGYAAAAAESSIESEPSGASGRSAAQGLGVRGYLRWFWRQLTSMQVALILLLLLAVATIPGSLVPQRAADPNGVIQFEQDHPTLFKVLDAFPIQAFDVYSSVWFSAIYLLLFISLIGCVLPRIVHHARALRGAPPRTPARLQRMVGFTEQRISNPAASLEERTAFAERAILAAEAVLKRQRYRTAVQRGEARGVPELSVSAERGYLRETGNLVFHLALVGVLVSVAIGGLYSFNGQRVLVEGETMLNQLIDYDTYTAGRSFHPSRLEEFSVRLDALEVDYITEEENNPAALGQVREYRAKMTLISATGERSQEVIRVNHPMRAAAAPVYLIANGYAPTVVVKSADGTVVYQESMPFIPQDDATMTSLGVLKVPYGLSRDGEATQLGLRGFFYPTQVELDTGAYASSFPALRNPVLTLDVFVGDLGINDGIPQSVYSLNTDRMEQLTGRAVEKPSIELRVGETAELPDDMGTITLLAVPRYASFDVMQNPTQEWILIFALIAVLGLLSSLFVPRRRMWVKAVVSEGGIVLQYAALARGDDPNLERAVEQLRLAHRQAL